MCKPAGPAYTTGNKKPSPPACHRAIAFWVQRQPVDDGRFALKESLQHLIGIQCFGRRSGRIGPFTSGAAARDDPGVNGVCNT